MKKTKTGILLAVMLNVGLLAGCTPPNSSTPANGEIQASDITKEKVVENYASIVHASYLDSLNEAKKMREAIQKLVAAPSAENLEAAKASWLKARAPYGQTEGFRFYEGPVDGEDGPEGQLNAWPMDEVYVDYVEGNPTAGIINNTAAYPEINAELITSLNEKDGDKNISTGYHTIEFLLWGQDLSDGAGAGQRPYTDYLTTGGTASNQTRRGQYLLTVADVLVSDLESLVSEWEPGKADNYAATFKKLSADEALTKILRGAGTLSASELSTERMATPLDIGEREEEHSCFSDNTHNDIMYNAKSIENILNGKYTATDGTVTSGPGIYHLVNKTDAAAATVLKDKISAAMGAVGEIKAPFDQEIKPGNTEGNSRVQKAVNALQEQGTAIVEAGKALGLSINTEL